MLNSIRRRSYLWTALAILIGIVLVLLFQWVTGDERHLYALGSVTGKIAWSAPLDWSWSSYAQPIVDNGKVFVATNDVFTQPRTEHWQVTAYDAGSGHTLWTYAPFGQAGVGQLCAATIDSPPIVANGHVYVYVCAATDPNVSTVDKASLVALDAATGAVIWEHDEPFLQNILKQGAALTLRVLNGSVYVLWRDSQGIWGIDVLDEKSGKLSRHLELPNLANAEPPVLAIDGLQTDGQSLFLNIEGLISVDPNSGGQHYILQVQKAPWMAENGLYATVSDGTTKQIVAYDAKSGEVRWQRPLDKSLIPDATDGSLAPTIQMRANSLALYMFAIQQPDNLVWLLALNPADGSKRWVKQIHSDAILANILEKVSTTPDLVAYSEVGDVHGIRVVSAIDGADRWFFPAFTKGSAPTLDGQHVYLFDESPRYRNWLALINTAWHGG